MPFKPDVDNLIDKIKSVIKLNEVPIIELMTTDFIITTTQFDSFEELLTNSGFKLEELKGMQLNYNNEWERFIKRNSRFESWKEMRLEAMAIYVRNELK